MNRLINQINEVLNNNNIGVDIESPISEALEKLFIYHEELQFQNDELRRANEVIENLKDDYETLFKEAPVAYLTLNDDLKIIKYNAASKVIFESTELANQCLTEFVDEESQDELYLFRRQMRPDGESVLEIDLNICGDIKSVRIHANTVKHGEENLYRFAIIDETIMKEQLEEIEYLSYHDQLTGANNRHFLNKELKRLEREQILPVGIIMLDVNGLKLVNDSFGHATGDKLLQQAGMVLKKGLRSNDILTRSGGDEFTVVLPETNELQVKQVMNRIRKNSAEIKIEDLTLSIASGHSMRLSEDKSMKDTLKEAEDRMYKDKLLNQDSQRQDVINSIIATLHEKHPREKTHSERVAEYVVMIGQKLGYEHEKLNALKTAAILHDIGKIAIDYSIIDKKGKLTAQEFAEVKRHPEIGFRILSSSEIFNEVSTIVLDHHEAIDGHGYPRGLSDEEINESAKIISVCDAYDAMISYRPYRDSLTTEEAVAELINGKGSQFSAEYVDLFIACLEERNLI